MIIRPADRMLALSMLVSSMALSSHALAVTVDGNVDDLPLASGSNPFAPFNWAEGVDANNDGDGVGFNILNTYAYYDVPLDTFYLGMTFEGAVGTSGGTEGGSPFGFPPPLTCGLGYTGTAGVFDASPCELYGFSLDINGDLSNEVNLRIGGDNVAGNGAGSSSGTGTGSGTGAEALAVFDNAEGATVTWAVGDGAGGNGVEFSIEGLKDLLDPMSPLNPRDVLITFHAGSGLHSGPEDKATLNMQVVPLPAAVWLFGSGLVGLVAASRRRSRA